MVYISYLWDDLVLAREKSIRDYLFIYWRKLVFHLLSSQELLAFQQCSNA